MTPPVHRRHLAALLVVGLGASIGPLDFAVNIAFPVMTEAFALPTHTIRWFVICYVLTYGSLMLGFGALGDRIGHLRVFRAGLVLGAISFVLCALAPDFGWLLAARVVHGVAVSLTLACAPALATLVVDERDRTWALSVYSGISALASAIAPLAGGVFVALLGWPGVFWFRLPVALLALACLPLLREPMARRGAGGLVRDAAGPVRDAGGLVREAGGPARGGGASARFDAAGSLLLAAAVALLLLGPSLLGPDSSPLPGVAVTASGVALMAIFVRHQRTAPFLPPAVARDADFRVLNVSASMVHFTGFAVPLMLPFYLLRGGGWEPLAGGAMVSVWAAGTVIGSAFASRLIRVVGTRGAAHAGTVASVAGLFAMAAWPATPNTGLMAASLVLHGVGIGLFQVAYTDLVVAALPVSARGVAGSLTMVTRTVGLVLGTTLWLWLLQAFEQAALAGGRPPRAAFMAGFGTVLGTAGAVSVAFFAAVLAWRALRR